MHWGAHSGSIGTVEVNDKDLDKTEFSTRDGLYEIKVMPFGLCIAPAT